MKTKIISLLAIAIAAALVTQPIFALTIDNIVLTENSSTSLSATYNNSTAGVTVLNTSPDHWTVTFAIAGVAFNTTQTTGGFGWIEPENSSNGNILTSPSGNNQLFIVSDALGHPSNEPNGGSTVVADKGDGLFITATFNDNGDVASVPETGSTIGLLFLSLIALLGASRRLRSVKLA